MQIGAVARTLGSNALHSRKPENFSLNFFSRFAYFSASPGALPCG